MRPRQSGQANRRGFSRLVPTGLRDEHASPLLKNQKENFEAKNSLHRSDRDHLHAGGWHNERRSCRPRDADKPCISQQLHGAVEVRGYRRVQNLHQWRCRDQSHHRCSHRSDVLRSGWDHLHGGCCWSTSLRGHRPHATDSGCGRHGSGVQRRCRKNPAR